MSLHALLESIHRAGNAQVLNIEKEAKLRTKSILTTGRAEASRIQEAALAAAKAPSYVERARIIQHARLQALQITGDAREVVVDEAMKQARGQLSSIRNSTIYPTILHHLLEEVLYELNATLEQGSEALIEADPRDKTLLEQMLNKEMMRNLSLNYTIKCWGGVSAKSKDGRVIIINTLEARFKRAKPYLRHYFASSFLKQA